MQKVLRCCFLGPWSIVFLCRGCYSEHGIFTDIMEWSGVIHILIKQTTCRRGWDIICVVVDLLCGCVFEGLLEGVDVVTAGILRVLGQGMVGLWCLWCGNRL